MESSAGPGMPLPKYCTVATTLKAPCWDPSFTCPFALRASWFTRHNPLTRYGYHSCLHIANPAWRGPGWLGIVGDAADALVLARREPDGFYYQAQIKPALELERQGTLLVEFEAPFVTGLKLPAQQQSVVLEEDVIPFSPSMEYALQPGDKVLALWEPDQQRYGPGTVLLGLETGDLQRALKDKEITVHFWNGKTAKVPRGGVRWVPPAVWKKAVERLHKPLTREHSSPLLWAPCSSLLGPVTRCVTNRPPPGTPFLCPPCQSHACCQLLCQGCLCCCPFAGTTWWSLTGTSEIPAREHTETELKPTAQLLPLEGPKEEEVAVRAPMTVSFSSSSSSSEEDLENDLEMGLPQRLTVNSTVNTDPVLLEKSPRQHDLCRPEWRYWRRNGPEPSHARKPGTRHWKEEKDNKQQRTQTLTAGNTKELGQEEAKVMMPLQMLPEDPEHRNGVRALRPSQRDRSSPQIKSPKDLGKEEWRDGLRKDSMMFLDLLSHNSFENDKTHDSSSQKNANTYIFHPVSEGL